MKYFLDTEFFEDGKTIDLISIGLVAEDGREFYAVSQEAELHRVSDWVRANVLPSLPSYGNAAWMKRSKIADGLRLFTGEAVEFWSGPTTGVSGVTIPAIQLDKHPEFWAYYADYDWVALCQLFGTMLGLPKHFPKFCRDLKQLSVDVGSPKHPKDPDGEHNALIDARWNRNLYKHLMAIKASQSMT